MIETIKYQQLGHADFGWLDARHHFSFGDYRDENRMGFGKLRVINDDIIQPGRGFYLHPHKDMEIITYVRQGAISHKDSQGNAGRTVAGDVQVMSAGTGIYHSEYNLESEPTRLYQIWIKPNRLGVSPRWDSAKMPKSTTKGFQLIASGDENAPLFINADAKLYVAHLDASDQLKYRLSNKAYILVSQGSIQLDNTLIERGDGAQISNIDSVDFYAKTNAEILLIDLI